MTYDEYARTHYPQQPISEYKARHEKKVYHVWFVTGPAGPVYEKDVLGWDKAKETVEGAWDYSIIRVWDGKEIV